MMQGFPILSLMLAVPAVAAIACLFVPAQTARMVALAATLVDLALGSRGAGRFQSGYLYTYAFVMLIGLTGAVTWAITR